MKELPNDFDGCWDPAGVDLQTLVKVAPALFLFDNKRAAQKAAYKGELFLANRPADGTGRTFAEFFQQDRNGNQKGIVVLDPQKVE